MRLARGLFRGGSGRFAGMLVAAALACCVGASTASASGGWSAPSRPDTVAGLEAVSCASASFCAASDGLGNVLTYNGRSWSAPSLIDCIGGTHGCAEGGVFQSLSCPSAHFCAAVDGQRALTYNGSSWSGPVTLAPPLGEVSSVSCASASFCVAVGEHTPLIAGEFRTADVVAWTYNGSAWSGPVTVESGEFGGPRPVSCASPSFCVAMDGAGNALTYNGSSWSAPVRVYSEEPGVSFPGLAVSCASRSFCVVSTDNERALVFNGKSWSAPTRLEGAGFYVSCPSASFCMGSNGRLAATYNGRSWSAPMDLHAPIDEPYRTVSCVSAAFCVTVGGAGVKIYRASKREQQEPGASVKLKTVRVTARNVVVTVRISRAGTLTIMGPGLGKTVETLAAGSHRVTVALTAAGKVEHKNHETINVSASLKSAGKTFSGSEIIKL